MEGWSKGEENYQIKFPPFRGRSELNDQRDNLKKTKKQKNKNPAPADVFMLCSAGPDPTFFLRRATFARSLSATVPPQSVITLWN